MGRMAVPERVSLRSWRRCVLVRLPLSRLHAHYRLRGQYDLGPDPRTWGADLSLDYVEDDDELHRPIANKSRIERDGHFLSTRGFGNLGCMVFLIAGLLALLCVLRPSRAVKRVDVLADPSGVVWAFQSFENLPPTISLR